MGYYRNYKEHEPRIIQLMSAPVGEDRIYAVYAIDGGELRIPVSLIALLNTGEIELLVVDDDGISAAHEPRNFRRFVIGDGKR